MRLKRVGIWTGVISLTLIGFLVTPGWPVNANGGDLRSESLGGLELMSTLYQGGSTTFAAGLVYNQKRQVELSVSDDLSFVRAAGYFPRRVAIGTTRFIHRVARRHGVDPYYLLGMMKAESGFYTLALGNAGERGMMQFMDDTAREYRVINRLIPRQSVAGAARLLKFLLGQVGGAYDLAVAAYNAGLANVNRYGGIPPFSVTQRHVNRVNQFAAEYRRSNKPERIRSNSTLGVLVSVDQAAEAMEITLAWGYPLWASMAVGVGVNANLNLIALTPPPQAQLDLSVLLPLSDYLVLGAKGRPQISGDRLDFSRYRVGGYWELISRTLWVGAEVDQGLNLLLGAEWALTRSLYLRGGFSEP
ncbi:MAG: transglycosylase SLT domain-containing protein, partial [Candidatus Bipolaricaulia bacterium]